MKNKNTKSINKIYFVLFSFIIIILFICCIINFFELNKVSKLSANEMYNLLNTNCIEKYQEVNIDYNDIIQSYIDEIFAEHNDTEMLMLHLNLERTYVEKVNLSVEEMKIKLKDIKTNGTRLNTYEHKVIDSKDVFMCKIGINDIPLTIYEYQPGIYSFAFDGFVE